MTRDLAGDFDDETHGDGYAVVRQPDPRIADYIEAALDESRSVINVGAATGSYEPTDRYVAAVEPSAAMRSQRAVNALRQDLDSGARDRRRVEQRRSRTIDASPRLIVAQR